VDRVPLPDGYELRAATLDEIPELARFIIEYDLEIGGYSDFFEDDLLEISKRRSIFDMGKDTWVVSRAGGPVALALAWRSHPNILNTVGAVKRSETGRGLGSILVDCTEDRARSLIRGTATQIVLRNSVDVKDAMGVRLLAGRGYEVARRHYTMTMMLDHEVDTSAPAGIRIRPTGEAETPILHRLRGETFAGNWGHAPVSYEEWSEAFLSRRDSDPSLWFLAETDGEPVGFLIGTFEGQRGWVSDLGVLAPWRRRGVGGALLRHAFAEFARRGLNEAGLEVDAGNETGAVHVYERVGLRPVRIYETFEKPFTHPRS
jgi:mycothiol synthase